MSNYTNNLFDPEEKNNPWVHLFDYVPKGSHVLDVGCSSGHFGEVLIHEKQCEVVGLDIDAPDIEIAKQHLTAAYVRNVEHDDLSDLGGFDVVMFVDVLEHLLDPIGALNRVKKLLNKNGMILFSIPNMAHISIRLMLMKGFFEYTPIGLLDRTHLHYYDEFEVEHIFAEAHLKIEEINAVTKPYPDSKVSEELSGLGLAIVDDKRFFNRLEESKAYVFQFVGYAQPAGIAFTLRERPIRYKMPPEELHLTLIARDNELQELGQRLRSLEAEGEQLRLHTQELEDRAEWFAEHAKKLEVQQAELEQEVERLNKRNKKLKHFYEHPVSGSVKRIANKINKRS